MTVSIDDLSRRLFSGLRRMDEEATTITAAGVPAGLNDYGRHVCPEHPRAEEEWTKRLKSLLQDQGVPILREVAYPGQTKGSRKRCDLVSSVEDDAKVWIEVKGVWRDFWNGGWIYQSYLLHPLVTGLDKTKTHTVPFDLAKLSMLRSPDAHYVAELVVGFERLEDPMDEDIETLVTLAGLSDWRLGYDSWMSPTVTGQKVRCWFWYRLAEPRWSVPGMASSENQPNR